MLFRSSRELLFFRRAGHARYDDLDLLTQLENRGVSSKYKFCLGALRTIPEVCKVVNIFVLLNVIEQEHINFCF